MQESQERWLAKYKQEILTPYSLSCRYAVFLTTLNDRPDLLKDSKT